MVTKILALSNLSDLGSMTFILELGLDIIQMYHHTKDKVSMSRHSSVIAQTQTQTDKQDENITLPYMWVVTVPLQ